MNRTPGSERFAPLLKEGVMDFEKAAARFWAAVRQSEQRGEYVPLSSQAPLEGER